MKRLLIVLILAVAMYQFMEPPSGIDVLLNPPSDAVAAGRPGLGIVLTSGGAGFSVDDLAVHGRFTIVEFYTESCPACRQLRAYYDQFLTLRPDVAVRRIRLPDRWGPSSIRARYGVDVQATPHVLIYRPNGELIAADVGMDKDGLELLSKWLNAELKRG